MTSFRIATYNIHKARGLDGRTRIDRILRVLTQVEADIIALQEVVSREGSAAGDHQASYLAGKLGHFHAIGETRKHLGGVYGNVTLSRWDFKSTRHIDLSVSGREERGVLRTDIPLGQEVLHVFNVHLGTAFQERKKQAARFVEEDLLKAIDMTGPRIVLGDFNEWTRGVVSQTLSSEFSRTNLRSHLSRVRAYPAVLPFLHLDHIYFDYHLQVESAFFQRSALAMVASDHLPLVANFSLREGSKT